MIITKLQGGLGNQLFQWAFGKAVSLLLDSDLFVDISFYNEVSNRSFELEKIIKDKINIIQHYDKSEFIIINDEFRFNNIQYQNFDSKKNYYLEGFWQSEKYFLDFAKNIMAILNMSPDDYSKYSKIIKPNSVSIHVRRTDYLLSNGFHPVQEVDYFNRAINHIGDYNNLYIFSDDISWCKENLKFKNSIFIEGFSNIDDLRLMSLCKNNIISNSSFSWWAAWLNKSLIKKVIAPKKWFGDHSGLNESDIVPDTWSKI